MVQEERPDGNGATVDGNLPGFSLAASSPPIFWKSRKRSASGKLLNGVADAADKLPDKQEDGPMDENMQDSTQTPPLSDRRKALFEPLEPVGSAKGRRPSNESLLPPPDFDAASYPRGWLIGKRRKLVNVDVVESMRRIAVQEMNRKDREIGGLNEQLEEDARCLEHLQMQLLDEKSKRSEVERENKMLHNQISMLMNMLDENESLEDIPDEP